MNDLSGKKCLIYTRCSTEEQGNKTSHAYQIRECKSFADRNKMIVLGHYSDTVTGTQFGNRTQLDIAYIFCGKEDVDYIIVYKIDRFGRDTEGALQTIRRFKDLGTEVNFTDEWINYQDPTWPLLRNIKIGLAETESLKISDRTKDGIYQTQVNGYWPFSAPVGYVKELLPEQKRNGKHKTMCVPDPEKAPIIKLCFQNYAEGMYSKTELFNIYKDELGISNSAFCRMFHNVFYSGYICLKPYKGHPEKIVKGAHEAIVSTFLFEKTQEFYNDNPSRNQGRTWYQAQREHDVDYYLKGVILCPNNYTKLSGGRSKSKTGRYYHYYATTSGKNRVNINVSKAHAFMESIMRDLSLPKEASKQIKIDTKKIVKKKIERTSNAIQVLMDAITTNYDRIDRISNDYADGQIKGNVFQQLIDKYENENLRTKMRIEKLQAYMRKQEASFSKVLDILTRLDLIFATVKSEAKTKILEVIFPQGIILDLENGILRTPLINKYLKSMLSDSVSYEKIKEDRTLMKRQVLSRVEDGI